MNDYHYIADDLAHGWFELHVDLGVAQLEEHLAKHAAFGRFLDGQDAADLSRGGA